MIRTWAGACDWVEQHPQTTLALVGLGSGLAYAAALVLMPRADGRVMVGDAVHYYVYLRSLVFDHDVHFQNEYLRLYGLTPPPPPGTEWVFNPLPTGYTRNMMPVGTAIVWLPLYLVAFAVQAALHAFGVAPSPDGYSRAFQATGGFSGIAAGTVAAWCAFRMCRELFGPAAALWATLAVWLGSSAIYYTMVSPTYSHASSMLATSLALWTWFRLRTRPTSARFFVGGALVGLAALVRVQDIVYLAAPLADAAMEAFGRDQPIRRLATACMHATAALAGAVAVFAPQMVIWSRIYGQLLLVPQGEGFMRWQDPHLADVLFSTYRGLFTWTPVIAVAVAGLLMFGPSRRYAATICAAIFLGSLFINAVAADWWAGEAFGARRFVSCFPVFVAGAAAVAARWPRRPAAIGAVVGVVVGMNLLLLFQYQLFLKGWRDIAPYPDTVAALWVARFVVPFRALARLAATVVG